VRRSRPQPPPSAASTVVVNNAGYANVNSIEDVAEDDFCAQIETNSFGVVNVTREPDVALGG
jgi:NAD(P)-dependent dehydrogenase (short-subunit alcohol dehydrogenase family)